jgi:hypothetical protein
MIKPGIPWRNHEAKEGLAVQLLQNLSAGLIARVASGDDLAAIGAPWLQDVLTEVFPDLYDGLRTRPVTRDRERPRSDIDLPWGQPRHVLGVLRTYQSRPLIPGRDVMFSEKSWPRFLARLRNYPHAVDVMINELDGRGFPVHRGWAGIGIHRDLSMPEWYRFTFGAMAVDTRWPEAPEIQDRWADLVKRHAAAVGAYAGGMNDDMGWSGETALQHAIGGNALAAGTADFQSVLRGYSWITIVPPEAAARLGGAPGLQASGAFCDVTELPNHAVWLRATPTINEFTGHRIQAVFETLAPELPAGKAEFRYISETYRLMEDADAADYQ